MTREELIGKLNQDLADELGAIIQYILYAASATGPYRPQLSQFFLAEVADEQLHAQFLANKIVALGGQPTTVPREVALPEGNRALLEADRGGRGPRDAGSTRSAPGRPRPTATRVWRCR